MRAVILVFVLVLRICRGGGEWKMKDGRWEVCVQRRLAFIELIDEYGGMSEVNGREVKGKEGEGREWVGYDME
jgi:hypothetical protein